MGVFFKKIVFCFGILSFFSITYLNSQEQLPGLKGYILDQKLSTISKMDLSNGKILKTVNIGDIQQYMMLSPDATKLIVLHGFKVKKYGLNPLSKAKISIFNTETMNLISTNELGWIGKLFFDDLEEYFKISPDSKFLYVYCPGYYKNVLVEMEFFAIDIQNGKEACRINLKRRIDNFQLISNKNLAFFFSRYIKTKRKNAPPEIVPSELHFVDLINGKILGSHVFKEGLPRTCMLSHDHKYVYVLDKKRIYVFSVESKSLVNTLDLEDLLSGVVLDNTRGYLLVLSNEKIAEGKRYPQNGLLYVIRGDKIFKTIKVPRYPIFSKISPNNNKLFVVNRNLVFAMDYDTFKKYSETPIFLTESTPQKKGTVSDMTVSKDGKRVYVSFSESSKLSILDLKKTIPITYISVGSKGRTFFKKRPVVDIVARAISARTGVYYYRYYSPQSQPPSNITLTLRPDNKYVYVHNPQSDDVSIIDAYSGKLEKRYQLIGNLGMIPFADGKYLWFFNEMYTLYFMNTNTIEKPKKINITKQFNNFAISPDKTYFFIVGKKIALCYDMVSSKIKWTNKYSFKNPSKIIIHQRK